MTEPWNHAGICDNIRHILERNNWEYAKGEIDPKADVFYKKRGVYILVEVKRLGRPEQLDRGIGQILRYISSITGRKGRFPISKDRLFSALIFVTREDFNPNDVDLDVAYSIVERFNLPFHVLHLSYFERFLQEAEHKVQSVENEWLRDKRAQHTPSQAVADYSKNEDDSAKKSQAPDGSPLYARGRGDER